MCSTVHFYAGFIKFFLKFYFRNKKHIDKNDYLLHYKKVKKNHVCTFHRHCSFFNVLVGVCVWRCFVSLFHFDVFGFNYSQADECRRLQSGNSFCHYSESFRHILTRMSLEFGSCVQFSDQMCYTL